jgi:hypothetical protein
MRGALARILREVAVGMADGTWEPMKACRADDRRWEFPRSGEKQDARPVLDAVVRQPCEGSGLP